MSTVVIHSFNLPVSSHMRLASFALLRIHLHAPSMRLLHATIQNGPYPCPSRRSCDHSSTQRCPTRSTRADQHLVSPHHLITNTLVEKFECDQNLWEAVEVRMERTQGVDSHRPVGDAWSPHPPMRHRRATMTANPAPDGPAMAARMSQPAGHCQRPRRAHRRPRP